MKSPLRIVFIVLALLLALMVVLPAIVSTGVVRRFAVKQVNARLTDGVLAVDDWSLGWWRGVQVRGVSYTDEAQRFGGTLESVSVSSGLLKLLAPRKDLGTITLVGPLVWGDATRLQAAPRAAPEPPPGKPAPKPSPPSVPPARVPLALDVAAKLIVQEARVELRRDGQPPTTLRLNATVDCPSLKEPMTFAVHGHGDAGERGGSPRAAPNLTLTGSVRVLRDGVLDPAAMAGEFALQATQFDLGTLALARAYLPELPAISGLLDSALTVKVVSLDELAMAGDVRVGGLRLEGGFLGTDHPQFEAVRLDVDITRRAGALVVKQLSLKSPLGTFKAAGELKPEAGAPYPRGQLSIMGDVDLAAVAAQVPSTMRLPPATRVSQGRIQLDGRITSEPQMLKVQAKTQVSELAGTQDGKAFAMEELINLALRAALTPQGPELESFTLSSAFANATGSGSATGALVQAEVDLDQAQATLGQFIDFGAYRFGGQLAATARLSSPSARERLLALEARVDKLVLAGVTPNPIRREQLQVTHTGVIQFSPEWKVTGLRGLQVAVDGLPLALKAQAARLDLSPESGAIATRLGEANVQAAGTLEDVLAFAREVGLLKRADLPLRGPLTLELGVSSMDDGYQIRTFALDSPPLSLTAAGQLMDVKASRRLRAQGTLASDCEQLALLTEAFTGYRPDMAGRASRDFTLDTALGAGDWRAILRGTEAQAGLHADRYQAFGVQATDMDLALSVHAARARVVFDTLINEGRLHAEPFLDVSGEPAILSMPTNAQVLSEVMLTEEMASELLARVHPIFYGCAVVGGRLSVTFDHLRVPLGPRMQQDTTFAGNLRLQNLVLGSGQGLLGQLLEALHVSSQEVQISNQVVRFECREGRITPSPLTFTVDRNKTLIVSGSVGLDQTLQYQVELPVTTNLLADLGLSDAAPYLKGTSVKVPIGGTVTSPRFDRQAFARALKEMGAKAARNAVIEEGGKLLGDFLKKRGGARDP